MTDCPNCEGIGWVPYAGKCYTPCDQCAEQRHQQNAELLKRGGRTGMNFMRDGSTSVWVEEPDGTRTETHLPSLRPPAKQGVW